MDDFIYSRPPARDDTVLDLGASSRIRGIVKAVWEYDDVALSGIELPGAKIETGSGWPADRTSWPDGAWVR